MLSEIAEKFNRIDWYLNVSQSKLIACDGRGGGSGSSGSVVGDGEKPPLYTYMVNIPIWADEFITLFLLLLLLRIRIETLILPHPFWGYSFDFYRHYKYTEKGINR